MHYLAIVLLFSVGAVLSQQTQSNYHGELDFIKVEEVFANPRLVESYGKCLLGKGHCTKEGAVLKKIIPQVIATKCANCTPEQKKKIRTALRLGIEKKKETFQEVLKKYSTEETYDSILKWMNSDD